MSEAYKCDRCKEVFAGRPKCNSVTYDLGVGQRWLVTFDATTQSGVVVDLCQVCLREILTKGTIR